MCFKIETWLKKGFTEEQAKEQIAMRRPTNVLYWVNKGFTQEEAVVKVSEFSRNGANKWAERPLKERLEGNHRRKEFWMKKGFSEEEAIYRVGLGQTRSLEFWIKKHGKEKGTEVWNKRQIKWQTTLKASSNYDEMNKKKSISYNARILCGDTKEEAELKVKTKYKNSCSSESELKEYLTSHFKENPFDLWKPPSVIAKQIISKQYLFNGWKLSNSIDDWLIQNFKLKNPSGGEVILTPGKPACWRKYLIDGTLLRSSNEITFYGLLIDAGFKYAIDFTIDRPYPNSNLRYDFKIKDIYVELSGLDSYPSYVAKMNFKKQTFGSIILTSVKQYKDFISSL